MNLRKASRIGRGLGAGFLLAAALFLGWLSPTAAAEGPRLVIDGREVQASPPPVIVSGRTLVPVRLVAETLGAQVEWHQEDSSVTITRNERRVKLWIDNRLVDLAGEGAGPFLTDVPPRIRVDRTFVPLRLVATALGVWVGWDEATMTVLVDAQKGPAASPAPALAFTSIQAGQVIAGPTDLQVAVTGELPGPVAELRFLLLDPRTGRGPTVARGKDLSAAYRWLPDPAYSGQRLLAAVAYDQAGAFLGGTVLPVQVEIAPLVSLAGLTAGQQVKGTVTLTTQVNFLAAYVRYDLLDQATGKVKELAKGDPFAPFQWTPAWADNGERTVRAVVYDRLGQAYPGPAVPVRVTLERRLALKGVAAGATVDGPVNLALSYNFPVGGVQYVLRDPATGQETVLAQVNGAAGYRWFPGPEQAGNWEVFARVTDGEGNVFRTEPLAVKVQGSPRLLLTSVGPNQVLSGKVELRALANVPLTGIEYRLVDEKGGARAVAGGSDAAAAYAWTTGKGDEGNWRLRAVGTLPDGGKLASEAIPVRVYNGPLYGPQPVIAKDRFLDFAADLAVKAQAGTGMSAALQVAQAILETGWGQSVPVDKYSGQPSYNLFGIKGQGPAGSVTSNTWEEYNGVSFRVDAAFRAYHDVAESWADHKRLLLTGARYEGFRAVMYDGLQGAWALKRAGYATDSQYPLKLLDLMRRYELQRLDEVAP